jgi:hypothetical protein
MRAINNGVVRRAMCRRIGSQNFEEAAESRDIPPHMNVCEVKMLRKVNASVSRNDTPSLTSRRFPIKFRSISICSNLCSNHPAKAPRSAVNGAIVSLENWQCIAIGSVSGKCGHLLCGIITVARCAAFKRDLKKRRDQRRRKNGT